MLSSELFWAVTAPVCVAGTPSTSQTQAGDLLLVQQCTGHLPSHHPARNVRSGEEDPVLGGTQGRATASPELPEVVPKTTTALHHLQPAAISSA